MARNIDAAVRNMMLIDVDVIIAWPAISGSTVEEILDAADSLGENRRPPVLIVSWAEPHEITPIDGWIKPPVAAPDLQRRVRRLLQHDVVRPIPFRQVGPETNVLLPSPNARPRESRAASE